MRKRETKQRSTTRLHAIASHAGSRSYGTVCSANVAELDNQIPEARSEVACDRKKGCHATIPLPKRIKPRTARTYLVDLMSRHRTGVECYSYCFEPHLLQKVACAGSVAPQFMQNLSAVTVGGAAMEA